MPAKKTGFEELRLLADEYINLSAREIYFDDEVNETTVGHAIRNIRYLEHLDDTKPIHIYLSSFGGSVYDGLGLYDVIRACSAPVFTYGHSKIMSMGTIILIAGDHRYAYPNTTVMVHEPSDFVAGQLEDIKIAAKEAERLADILVALYVEHTTTKDPAYWRGLKKDTYFSAETALEMGMIDEIL